MREQSFNGLPTPSAFFDPDTFSWRTSKDSLLKEDLTSLERLQPFGMTVAGRLYELATPEHLISVRDGSQSRNLPTPTAQAAKHRATPDKTANAYGKNLWDIPHLLPTPTAWIQDEVDMEKYLARRERVRKEANNGNGFGMALDMTVRLLPTPTTQDAANNAGPAQWKRNSLPLNCIAVQIGENGSPPSDDGKPSDK
tara:strand:- start:615 stop:1205 length:591 start_codon:yes stop_codon:yes gene_type:complete